MPPIVHVDHIDIARRALSSADPRADEMHIGGRMAQDSTDDALDPLEQGGVHSGNGRFLKSHAAMVSG